ncbi:bifunctional ADP-dependent NAD(P)H-hydrate dehydratase/NAD(P)H-hydrate epimerase, partial [Candidatus Woesearchaeota archaeon]|nr:bifunctional ADP-dependent NAD(P)H-hydrate dehydratase/NAD(P)H-hydrate epimerase [Candidatus Woesearchaeota archaeon]
GINGPLHDPISFGIDYFNSLNGAKIAVDIPSGLDPDTGEVVDKVCHSDLIVTFHDIKCGLEQFQDKTEVVDIGIPK